MGASKNTVFYRLALILSISSLLMLAGCTEETGVGPGASNGSSSDAGDGTAGDVTRDTGGTEPDCSGDQCTCPESLSLCGDTCYDLSSNVQNCSECGNDCGQNATCNSGNCACQSGFDECGETCVDQSTNFNHCGECGNQCGENEQCVSGNCEPANCTGDQTSCQGMCVNTDTNTNHCGECDNPCGAGEVCQEGNCICQEGASCEQVGTQGSVVGGPCSSDDDCQESCLDGDSFPDGTCSVDCTTVADCPGDTVCVDIQGGTCLLSCESEEQCREEYDCASRSVRPAGSRRVCVSG